jgi:GTP-binding protein
MSESAPDPLVIRSLEFVGGMASVSGWRPPEDLPEIAFAGRSNVGKSSLLNRLVRRRAFARVSRTPGRTREINFFKVNGQFILADLPGYGYARISKEKKADWKPLIEGYLRRTKTLAGVVLLLDIRRDPSDDDMAMLDYLAELEVPSVIVLTKIDKISRGAVDKRTSDIMESLSLSRDQIIQFSSSTGEGRSELAGAVATLVETARNTSP